MKILQDLTPDEEVISLVEAEIAVENKINNKTQGGLYIVKYKGEIVSFSGEYYKFAWKDLRSLRTALTQKFGREFSEALVENDVIEIIKVNIT